MVKSQINSNVEYDKKMDAAVNEDMEHISSVYEMELMGKNVELVLGKEREEDNVVYFIGYVVLENSKVRPVGIFEIEKDKVDTVKDDDGDIDLDYMNEPILFENIDLSDTLIPSNESPAQINESPAQINESPAQINESPAASNDVEIKPLKAASRKEEEAERELVKTGLWVQQYTQNKNYNLVDNEGGGDCLFAVIRDGLNETDKKYTVGDLRKLLSDEVTPEIFENYRLLYTSFEQSIKDTKSELNNIAKENAELKERLSKEVNASKQLEIVKRAKKLKVLFDRLKSDMAISKQMLDEQKFMKNITSLDQFKAMVNTCRFWGDTWAISTLERVLNTKFILLSEESFLNGDIKNILQCGQLNDKVLQDKGVFTPDNYIIMNYDGSHYKLVTYKNHGIFNFNQLPYFIRDIIVDKCLERMSGPYAIIPDFINMKREQEPEIEEEPKISDIQSLDVDPETVFMYYSRSNSKPLPGKGTGEKIREDRRNSYKKLASMKDWRKKLSNEWPAPIDIDGHQWKSVEHYYQGSKYKKSKPEIYYQFTLDSRSELGNSVDRAKKFKDFEPDIEFYGKRGKEVLHEGLKAKFTQHPDLRNVLLATLDATLMEYIHRKPPRFSNELMEVRKNLTV
jgi:predicted NAD-dependent protein-ADP-ribosyltransferase YbiA (DUF1768 family)